MGGAHWLEHRISNSLTVFARPPAHFDWAMRTNASERRSVHIHRSDVRSEDADVVMTSKVAYASTSDNSVFSRASI